VVHTEPDREAERGSHPWWLAALGAALLVLGALLSWQPPADEAAGIRDRARSHLPPYVVEPAVRLKPVARERPLRVSPRRDPAAGPPTRLIVPTLGIDAPVVGIAAADGVLSPPADPQTLGALITGHTVHTGGGAMDDLETLHSGDAVRVRTARGTIAYEVSAVAIYRKGRLARDAQRVFSQDGPGRLVLITCEDWNGSGYDSNAIVFAERRR
jgi:LPXTG-site transpeptidase (sortase) family protein